jgi:tetratricopeptide (TPR) repeat protein
MLGLAAWRLRSKEFGALHAYDDGRPIVVMELDPEEPDRLEEWISLRQLWLELSPHPHILDAIAAGTGSEVLLRYAALDWKHAALRLDPSSIAPQLVASWGAQLASAFQQIVTDVPEAEAGHLLRPLVKIDLANNVRLAFLPVAPEDAHLPPEVRASWPRCDERAFVYLIGRLVRDSYYVALEPQAATAIEDIVAQCLREQPSERYATLEELHAAWTKLAFRSFKRDRLEAWQLAQEGMGWLELGQPRSALHAFRAAIRLNPRLLVAKSGRERALAALGEPDDVLEQPETSTKPPSWAEVAATGQQLEAEHEVAEALSLYGGVALDGVHDAETHAAIARCFASLGTVDRAIEYARRALAVDPRNLAALSAGARAYLLDHRHQDALRIADEWLAVDSGDGSAHYARGRALFALGRFVEARDAFDRACSLRPQMLEAMLLRREADRSVRRTADQAGTARPIRVEVPAHLQELRDALVSGRVQEAIPVLERPEYDHDAVAKLVHAACLAFAQRFEEAIAMYDRAAAISPDQRVPALIGKVQALLSLDRAGEALAELDAARDLVDVDLVELRGLALRRVGLDGDAEHELGRVVAASGSRSDLRVGRR